MRDKTVKGAQDPCAHSGWSPDPQEAQLDTENHSFWLVRQPRVFCLLKNVKSPSTEQGHLWGSRRFENQTFNLGHIPCLTLAGTARPAASAVETRGPFRGEPQSRGQAGAQRRPNKACN